jgi:predicted acylesterase/phospholipase RssA
MTVSEIGEDYEYDLSKPTLDDLYKQVEFAKNIQNIFLTTANCSIACALPAAFFLSPIAACSLVVIAAALTVSSTYFNKPPPYLILAIDGGGIRGMIPAQMLALIEKEVGVPIGKLFDCVAGTSIGGILALSLVQSDPNNPSLPKRTAAESAQFLEIEGPKVFERTRAQTVQSMDGVREPKYSNKNLSQAVEREFQTDTISNSITDVVITTYDLTSGKPFIFSHFKNEKSPYLMKDISLGTAAAPIYFPSYPIQNLNLVDGGLVANNPSFIAFIKAKEHIDPNRDIFILSLGTGEMTLQAIPADESKKYGMIQWLPILFDVIFKSMQETQMLQLEHIKNTSQTSLSLLRLQPQLETKPQEKLDNASPQNIQQLKTIATNYFNQNHDQIDKEIIQPLKKYRA